MTKHKLSAYEQARLDKIARNEKRLKELGLHDAKKHVRALALSTTARRSTTTPLHKKKKRKAKQRAIAIVSPDLNRTRSSRRLSKKPVQYEPSLMDDDEEIRNARKKKFKDMKRKIVDVTKTTKKTSSFKCIIPDSMSAPLSVQEKKIIETKMEGDFLGKFEEYVDTVDALSDQNKRNVMRQVTKLVTGEGIRYDSRAYGWPEGCYFLKGTEVKPTDDILKLMDLGRECEDEWGRDHGNGWLLSHPLKKMYMFQQYHLMKK